MGGTPGSSDPTAGEAWLRDHARYQPAVWLGVLLPVALLLSVAVGVAGAAAPLTRSQREGIVRSTRVAAPNGGRIRDWRCIDGRLSTVNRRFASVILTNTRVCVRRYGGATGEARLDERATRTSSRWRPIGSLGGSGTCVTQRGVSHRVLRDLGCDRIVAINVNHYCGEISTTSGSGSYIYRARVWATRVSCATARSVAKTNISGGGSPHGWSCLAADVTGRCADGSRRIRFAITDLPHGDASAAAPDAASLTGPPEVQVSG
jgi:hypothetical protein